MAIPELNTEGLLPAGIHSSELPEIRQRFGSFNGSDRRAELFARLEQLARAMQTSKLFAELLIDGSFVTAKLLPNDVDVIAVLLPNHAFERDMPMSEYALVSRTLLRRRFGFDVMVAEQNSSLYKTYVEFFSRVRELPDHRKGLLRLAL
jgi:hypothetical protein